MATKKVLLAIFGAGLNDLTENELAVAQKVADYFDASVDNTPQKRFSEGDIINACKYALEKEGESWESIMLNPSHKKEIVTRRIAIISIVCRRTCGTQVHKAQILGGLLDRTTIARSERVASDGLMYDHSFKELYATLSNYVNEYLESL